MYTFSTLSVKFSANTNSGWIIESCAQSTFEHILKPSIFFLIQFLLFKWSNCYVFLKILIRNNSKKKNHQRGRFLIFDEKYSKFNNNTSTNSHRHSLAAHNDLRNITFFMSFKNIQNSRPRHNNSFTPHWERSASFILRSNIRFGWQKRSV